jgi:hypothetical protein
MVENYIIYVLGVWKDSLSMAQTASNITVYEHKLNLGDVHEKGKDTADALHSNFLGLDSTP